MSFPEETGRVTVSSCESSHQGVDATPTVVLPGEAVRPPRREGTLPNLKSYLSEEAKPVEAAPSYGRCDSG